MCVSGGWSVRRRTSSLVMLVLQEMVIGQTHPDSSRVVGQETIILGLVKAGLLRYCDTSINTLHNTLHGEYTMRYLTRDCFYNDRTVHSKLPLLIQNIKSQFRHKTDLFYNYLLELLHIPISLRTKTINGVKDSVKDTSIMATIDLAVSRLTPSNLNSATSRKTSLNYLKSA